jgi:hypothetical protein
MRTLEDLCEELRKEEECLLLELLGLTSEDLVERFQDVIEERQEYLRRQEEFAEEDEILG